MANLHTITWEPHDPESVAAALRVIAQSLEDNNPPIAQEGFDSPVGTVAERASAKMWPGDWFDATGYAQRYEIRPRIWHIHTGADLNLNKPKWDTDRGQPVYACADGVVTHVGKLGGTWGNVIVIQHPNVDGQPVYSRYAHVDNIVIEAGGDVVRGQQIAVIGRPNYEGSAYHLHFDISLSDILKTNPGHWPGDDLPEVLRNYTDPRRFIESHRPG